MKEKIKVFFRDPETFTELMFKVGIITLVSMALLYGVKVVDGPNHRLGVIVLSDKL